MHRKSRTTQGKTRLNGTRNTWRSRNRTVGGRYRLLPCEQRAARFESHRETSRKGSAFYRGKHRQQKIREWRRWLSNSKRVVKRFFKMVFIIFQMSIVRVVKERRYLNGFRQIRFNWRFKLAYSTTCKLFLFR